MGAGPGRVLCDDVLRRRMRTCALSVSSTVGLSIPALRLGTSVPRQKVLVHKETQFLLLVLRAAITAQHLIVIFVL